jgi:hypothetical protein
MGVAALMAVLGLFVVGAPVSASTTAAGRDYVSIISSGEEVPLTDTGTYGWATYHVSDDGQSMTWTLWINAINDPIAAHIHVGGVGVNGPVVVLLYSGKNVGPFSGVMSSGTMTEKDLDGPLKGKTMDDLLTAIRSGNAYTNVHTVKHPGGEARGQIHSAEASTTAYGTIG